MEPKQCFVNIDEVLDKFSDIKTIDFNFENDSINVVKKKRINFLTIRILN